MSFKNRFSKIGSVPFGAAVGEGEAVATIAAVTEGAADGTGEAVVDGTGEGLGELMA